MSPGNPLPVDCQLRFGDPDVVNVIDHTVDGLCPLIPPMSPSTLSPICCSVLLVEPPLARLALFLAQSRAGLYPSTPAWRERRSSLRDRHLRQGRCCCGGGSGGHGDEDRDWGNIHGPRRRHPHRDSQRTSSYPRSNCGEFAISPSTKVSLATPAERSTPKWHSGRGTGWNARGRGRLNLGLLL